MQTAGAFSLAEIDRGKGGSPPTIALTVGEEQTGVSDDALPPGNAFQARGDGSH